VEDVAGQRANRGTQEPWMALKNQKPQTISYYASLIGKIQPKNPRDTPKAFILL
jgi:hypothetical protein